MSEYLMEYISDRNVYKAVMFSRSMIRKGESPRLANYKAARYYGVSVSQVAHYVGQAANNVKNRRK